jgi:hypothetical protein
LKPESEISSTVEESCQTVIPQIEFTSEILADIQPEVAASDNLVSIPAELVYETFCDVDDPPEAVSEILEVPEKTHPLRLAELEILVQDLPSVAKRFLDAETMDGDRLECSTVKPRARKRTHRFEASSSASGRSSKAEAGDNRKPLRTVRYV